MNPSSCSATSRRSRFPPASRSTLKLGSVGYITQALGGSFTVYIDGNLFRIAGSEADAIGKTRPPAPEVPPGASEEDIKQRRLAAAEDLL